MNRFARTFILIGLVVAMLLAMHFLPPIVVGSWEARPVNLLSDVIPEPGQDDADVLPVVPLPDAPATPATAVVAEAATGPADSTAETPKAPTSEKPGAPAAADSTASATSILDYSQGQAGGMAHFYERLSRCRELGRPVRVAYYGDSFIEGDIFTADLRELLQDAFGGSGVGWMDCASQVSGFRTTVRHTSSGLSEYEVVKRPFSPSNQGIAQRYFTASDGARITYKGAKVRRHLADWERAILYLRTDGGLTLRTTLDGDTTTTESVPGSPNLQAVVAGYDTADTLHHAMGSVSFTVSNIGSGTLLYGVALEPRQGVVVDNFSMRGSAGYTLAQIPNAMLAQFASLRPYDLIVLHYGLNVANAKQTDYSGYTRQMGRAIDHLREAYPQASILVVGMPDRDQRTDAGLRTMRGVEQLVAYQQLMASDHQVAFFNLFQAMGGRESMRGLVERGLANKDYTHINFAGGRQLARLLYDALMEGYRSHGY